MSRTIVCFHAHPDDEALLTGGTMARLAAEGHRVVLVTATAGEAGLASGEITATQSLAELRRDELTASAAALGCERVVMLGYADSGMAGQSRRAPNSFCDAPIEEAAERVARLLTDEGADVVTTYDPAGGYGHPDHLQVHRVGKRAAELAGTPVTLEATVDRRALQRALRAISWLRPRSPDFKASRFDDLYTHPDKITHCVDVRGYLDQKRASMQAHVSQTTADDSTRTLALFLRLPGPLFRLAFGREWFVEHHRPPANRRLDDLLASLR